MHHIKFIKSRFFLRITLFFLSLIWFAGIISPCVDVNFAHINYPILKLLYSHVCHQTTDKSFFCNNNQFLVCSRCSGIYSAVLLTSFIILFINKHLTAKTSYLVLFSIPMLLDVILYSIGIYEYSKSIAFITGLLFGSVVFLYILSGIENSFYQKSNLTNES